MKKVSKRIALALEVLAEGGYFRMQLEASWHGRERFKTRLRTKTGQIVAGVGFKAQRELEKKGVIKSRPCERSSVWPQEWELAPGALEKIQTEGL